MDKVYLVMDNGFPVKAFENKMDAHVWAANNRDPNSGSVAVLAREVVETQPRSVPEGLSESK